jgi:hypothetical protein
MPVDAEPAATVNEKMLKLLSSGETVFSIQEIFMMSRAYFQN